MSKTIHFILGAAGLALLYWMAQQIGFDVLKENFLRFGFSSTFLLIAVYSLAQIAFCMAWFVLLKDQKHPIGFWRTFYAYAAGDALNMTVPSGNLAGEPVKIMLIKNVVNAESALASVTVYKFADFLSMTLFLLAGWGLHFFFYKMPAPWVIGGGVILFGMTAASVLFFFIQQKGFFLRLGKLLHSLGLEKWVESKLQSAHIVDEAVRKFYDSHHKPFALSVFYNFLAWFGGVLEIMIFMRLLNLPVSFPAALTVETFSLFVNNISFFVPARIGVGEGARTLLFVALGYTKDAGLSYGIVRRIRELAWVGIGFLILFFSRRGGNGASGQTPRAQI